MKQRSLFARCPDWTESLSRYLLGLNQQVVRIWNIKSCSKLDENEGTESVRITYNSLDVFDFKASTRNLIHYKDIRETKKAFFT